MNPHHVRGWARETLFGLAFCGVFNTVVFAQAEMYAHFIEVGQADATLLEFSCGAMLIDAGAQDEDHVEKLIDYLEAFFAQRGDLNRTFASIIITHNDLDHNSALRRVMETFEVGHYIDNGKLTGKGRHNAKWVRTAYEQGEHNARIRSIPDEQVVAVAARDGLTNDHIDPLACQDCDPRIAIVSGRLDVNPGWSKRAFKKQNNHSLVTRVDFGEASFLFTGDLEKPAIATLLEWYDGTVTLDTDVYQVGHHGSYNATTRELLTAVTPEIAVISCGKWNFGKNSKNQFTTWRYGHPRRTVTDLLAEFIERTRSTAVTVHVAEGSKEFVSAVIKKKIYATPWDGTIKVRATQDGKFRVTHLN